MFAGRFGRTARVVLALCAVAVIVGIGWFAYGYFKPQPDVQLVDKYFTGYRDANLSLVRSSVSADLLESLPTTQGVFEKRIKDAPDTRVKSWRVTRIDRNPYIGQSMVDVSVVTAKSTYNVEMDVFDFTEGLRIRQVKDLSGADSSPVNAAPKSTGEGGGYHGGTGGMPTQGQ
jgi:hypothetical protein